MIKIPLSNPDITVDEIKAVSDVLKTPNLSLGPKITEFEKAIADFTGVRYAVALNSATSGLHLIIRAMGIGAGDEVITSPFSFISSANCILFEDAKPVFVDICQDTLNIDPDKIGRKINKKTKAVLAVDVFGHLAEWDKLKKIAKKHNLYLIEDSAEAFGSEYKGKKCGIFADAGVFSFYPNKQITTGEGGVVVTDNREIAWACRSMSNQGRKIENNKWLNHTRLGYNYRMSDINAALGIAQLKRVKDIFEKRSRVADMYYKELKDMAGVCAPYVAPGVKLSWFVYVVRLSGRYSKTDRDRIIEKMAKKGIECRNYFQPIHTQPCYKDLFGYKKGDFPVCEAVADRTIALPFYNNLRKQDVRFVVKALKEILKNV